MCSEPKIQSLHGIFSEWSDWSAGVGVKLVAHEIFRFFLKIIFPGSKKGINHAPHQLGGSWRLSEKFKNHYKPYNNPKYPIIYLLTKSPTP